MRFQMLQKFAAWLLVLLLVQPSTLLQAQDKSSNGGNHFNKYYIAPKEEPVLSPEAMGNLLHQKIKYVFVLYQENRSFDSYFGTFPGAEGLFSQPAAKTPGFYQKLTDTNGSQITIQPFRIGPYDRCPNSTVNGTTSPTTCYAADTDDIDHIRSRAECFSSRAATRTYQV